MTDVPATAPPRDSDAPDRSEAEQVAFFEAMLDGWQRAAARVRTRTAHLDVAGIRVALAFAGDALADVLLPALMHLAVPDETRAADVTIHCWDSRSTGVAAVPPPCGQECFTERGDIWGMTSARIRSAFHWHEFSVNVMDRERGVGVYWVEAALQLPYWSAASPLRTMLHWTAEAHGAQLLHAAAVGDDRGAVLITGRGGVGKSSTALACLADGMRYVGDDYLVVRVDPTPRVFSLYCTAKLDPGQLARFPALAAHVANAGAEDDKAVLQLQPAFAAQLALALPLRAIVTPTFGTSAETSVAPVAPGVVQRAASFTTLSQLPGAGRGTHALIDRLVGAVPGFTLRLGHDRARVPAALRALLGESDATLRAAASSGSPAAMGRPVVSVIVPVYNGVAFLERCVRAILAQDYAPLEILIVDDGSTDDVDVAVRALPVDVRFVRQANAGPAAARNRGLREASGDLIAFVDVDDYWPERTLATLVERLTAAPDMAVVHGAAQVVRESGEPDAPAVYVGSPADAFPYYIGAGLYRRTAFERVGPFDATLRFGEDSDWFHRAREAGLPVLEIPEVCLVVRRHAGNMTRGKSLVELGTLRVIKKALDRRRGERGEG